MEFKKKQRQNAIDARVYGFTNSYGVNGIDRGYEGGISEGDNKNEGNPFEIN